MGLDYTEGCVNFRDFGGYVNLIAGQNLLPEGKLYRGGSIDYVEDLTEIGQVKSIINLRNGRDRADFEVNYFHFPMSNKIEKYNTPLKEVQLWLNTILQAFETAIEFPVLIHCLSGKDRTGIVVAALLLILEIDPIIIEEEYLLSQGEVQLELIQTSIRGMQNIEAYFNRVNLDQIKKNILIQ